jgi:hypothetical protein
MTKEKSKDFDQFEKVMDIVREMSQEEIDELLQNNPLYKFITENDKKVEKRWRIKKK